MTNSPDLTPAPAPEAARKRRWRIGRRGFLIGVGATGGALALGYFVGMPALHLRMAESLDGGSQPADFDESPWLWFEVAPSGRLRLHLSKVEMGQGVHTSLAQIAAEELGLQVADLEVAQAGTDFGPQDTGTSGSSSVSTVFMPLRRTAATLRAMLLAEAAAALGAPGESLSLDALGIHVADDPARAISYTDLVAQKQGEWEPPAVEVPLAPAAYRVIGAPVARVDIPDKVTGRAVYGYDLRVEGMKYGAVLRPPTLEARALSIADGGASAMPGVVKVVIEEGWAGVVADSRAQAYAAVNALEVEWETGRLWSQAELDALVVAGPESGAEGVVIQRDGNAARALQEEISLSAEYRTPLAVQTPLEAQAALAEPLGAGEERGLRIHLSTQMAALVRDRVAEATGLPAERISVTPSYLGGGFGRKSGFEPAIEAAKLALAAGVPVHIGWNRTEELRYGYFRPPTHHRLYGRLDGNGRLVAVEHRHASGEVAFGFLPGFLTVMMGADFGATRGARFHYDGIAHRAATSFRPKLPVATGWWRGLGLLANTFAIESFIDEAAHLAGADPIEFRLAHLAADAEGDDSESRRFAAVIRAAAALAEAAGPAPAGRARGFACCIDVGTIVAEIAEISLDAATGQIRVHNVWAAMDCGLCINPNGAAAQVEGNIMWGVGSALLEEVTVADGQIVPANFDSYPLLRLADAPNVTVTLLDGTEDHQPRGVGEPPIGPVAAAIANALFALTGARVRTLPLTPATTGERFEG